MPRIAQATARDRDDHRQYEDAAADDVRHHDGRGVDRTETTFEGRGGRRGAHKGRASRIRGKERESELSIGGIGSRATRAESADANPVSGRLNGGFYPVVTLSVEHCRCN